MKKFLSVIVLFFGTQFYAQSIDSIVKRRSEKFILEGIKDFFYYERFCVGTIKITKKNEIDCSLKLSNLYVFWKENGKSFFQEINLCESPKIRINNKVIAFYLKESAVIEKENLEQYKTGKDSIIGNKIYSKIRTSPHSCHSKIYFYKNLDLIEKHISEFDLTTENKIPNINFERNNNLKMVQLAKDCLEIIKSNKKRI